MTLNRRRAEPPGTVPLIPVTSILAYRIKLIMVAAALSVYPVAHTAVASSDGDTQTHTRTHKQSFQRFSSGSSTVPLVELFTSEGCSSCPPADRWLSKLKSHQGLWTEFVPVAFHVNYWDELGWPDRFAKEQFGQRQRRYSQENVVRGVYTPGVVSGGTEWHGWRIGSGIPLPAPGAGELSAVLKDDALVVNYAVASSDTLTKEYRVHAAWLAMDQVSTVRAGENRGKRLTNDFVVLATLDSPLTSKDGRASTRFSIDKLPKTKAKALAIWVTQDGLQAPLQATGGWIE